MPRYRDCLMSYCSSSVCAYVVRPLQEGGEGGVPYPVKRLKMTEIFVTLGSKTLKMAQIRVKQLNA
jgi:hypothetical protein